VSRFACIECHADPVIQPDCRACAGSGLVRDVPYAKDPWNQLVLNLWLGGHDYSPDGEWDGQETPKISSDMFNTVISFYQRFGSPQTSPGLDVQHYYHRIPDGPLDEQDLNEVYALSKVALAAIDRPSPVLIRCQAGLNRSSLCAGYVLMQMGFTPERAIKLIRDRRSPYALCNLDFVDYLMRGLPE